MIENIKRKAALRNAVLKIAAEVDFVGAQEFGRLNEAEAREWNLFIGLMRSLDAAENKDRAGNHEGANSGAQGNLPVEDSADGDGSG